VNDEINRLIEPLYGAKVETSFAIGGGSINQTQVISLTNGQRVFCKQNPSPPVDFFLAETRGLKLLAQPKTGLRIPKPIAVQSGSHPRFLLLEYIESSTEDENFTEKLAISLAQLHRTSMEYYGLDHDNYIGSTPQKNTLEKDGIAFFREQRINFQRQVARLSGLLPVAIDKKLDSLCDELGKFLNISGEKPALMHGDLWSGNYFPDSDGNPCIFDPAVYYGLREADLAMTELFGRLPQKFYDVYQEVFPMNPGYEERKDLFNLYHLLNHLNIFGNSYLSSVERVVNSYTD
jgi:protein-ribulosamine 3-kinase